jgi:diguanylate cyclase (GGDEF)-like protein
MAFLRWERRVSTTQSKPSTAEPSRRVALSVPRLLSRIRPEVRVGLIGVLLAFVAGLILVALPNGNDATRPSPAWVAVALLVAFAATEVTVFEFAFRREAAAFSLSEIPLAFALVYLPPSLAIAVRVVGPVAVYLLILRQPLYKLVLNIGMFTFEVVVAFAVFRAVIGAAGSGDSEVVVAAILATLVGGLVSFVVVPVAIAQFDGGLWRMVGNQIRVAWWFYFINAAVAGVVLGLALISPYFVLIALVPVGVLWYVLRAYGSVEQQLHDLDAIHGFTGQVGRSLDPDEIIEAAVAQTALLLRTDGTAIVLFRECEPAIRKVHGIIGVELPSDIEDEGWLPMIQSERAMLVSGALLDPVRTPGSKVSEMMAAPIRDGSGVIGLLVVAGRTGVGKRFGNDDVVRLQNLTEQLTASLRRGMLHQRIEREARHDLLTGLPNRLSFERSVGDAATAQSGGQFFVVLLDLDRFKEVNDTLGHHAGDQLLIETGGRLRAVLAPGDVLARLAADEFAVVGQRATREEMLELAWACVREVGRPVTIDGLEIVVTASAGLAVVDENVEEGAPLRYADVAMFNAKTQRSGVEVYRDEIDRRTPARLSMLGDLRTAIEDEQLHMHLQPKLDLSTGTVVGAEALVRWTHPMRGVVTPAQFVRIAEDTGLIKQLTDLMLHRGISTLSDIHRRGYLLGLSVNLSTHDLLDRRLAERVQQHLTANDVDPSMLTLEITESSLLIDAPRARATIDELHEVGVSLSIDDFGTGYSSLSYLRRLPVAELKIDQSFIANVLLDEQDEVIVRSTIDLGHNLGLVVVAEGVENNEVLERLRELGCDVAQGYCISRPLAPGHFLSWLATTGHPSRRVDPLDFSRWVDTGPGRAASAPDPALD